MKSIHSYFKLKGGQLKTKYHSQTWVRSRFFLSVFFFWGGGGVKWEGESGVVLGGMGACLLPTNYFFLICTLNILVLISSVAAKLALRPHA